MIKLLQLKHWQLFTLLFGLPFLLNLLSVAAFTPGNANTYAIITSAASFLWTGTFMSWFWALGTKLHKKLPGQVSMNISLFRTFLIIPLVYIFLIFGFVFNLMASEDQASPGLFAIIVPLHLFAMFCIFYCLYFNAKVLKAVEWQKEVTFSDYAGEFFLIWFFPIGIWFIQPRINRIIGQG